jgi:large subunit ribosomal protein L11
MKKIEKTLKLHIPAGKANPAPPLGPSLAECGLNIAEFCQKFNDLTKEKGSYTIPVRVSVFEDRTYEMELLEPLTSELLKEVAGIEKGAGEPNRKKVAKISKEQLRKVAERKMKDLNARDIESAMEIVTGTARSMGIEIS